jgi:hypothetical protein
MGAGQCNPTQLEEGPMKKLITIVALTASAIATPAFAQSPYRDFRTGYVLPPYGYERTGVLYNSVAPWQGGLYMYDMVPGEPWYRNGGVVTGGVQPNH